MTDVSIHARSSAGESGASCRSDDGMLLRGRAIAKSFGRGVRREQVLFGVDIDVRAGQCLAVIGGSGSGKSTLTRILLGLETADSGIVEYRGLPVNVRGGAMGDSGMASGEGAEVGGSSGSGGKPEAVQPLALTGMRRLPGYQRLRRESGLVFQDPFGSLDPRWTVGRSVAEPLILGERARWDAPRLVADGRDLESAVARSGRAPSNGAPSADRRSYESATIPERVAEALRTVALDPVKFAGRYPCDLSGGQAQRVAIARAIVNHPRLILADEPMSAIDVAARVQILEALQSIVHGGAGDHAAGGGGEVRGADMVSHEIIRPALIIVSHDLGVVRHLADRIIVLHDGRVVEQGATDEVLGNPRHEYTRQLIAAASL